MFTTIAYLRKMCIFFFGNNNTFHSAIAKGNVGCRVCPCQTRTKTTPTRNITIPPLYLIGQTFAHLFICRRNFSEQMNNDKQQHNSRVKNYSNYPAISHSCKNRQKFQRLMHTKSFSLKVQTNFPQAPFTRTTLFSYVRKIAVDFVRVNGGLYS